MTPPQPRQRPWVKSSPHAPAGFFETEAAGLRWIAETHTVPTVNVIDVSPTALTLEHLAQVAPTADAARTFGERLALLHDIPATAFGQLPPGAQASFFGPLASPIALPDVTTPSFGTFYADGRLTPLIERCQAQGALQATDVVLMRSLCDALRSGVADEGRPSVTHGDLWSGNLMWTSAGVTLIDPAACGQHPMADIAMLTMFGCPHLDAVLAGYTARRPLPSTWRNSLGLHQLFAYLVHLHLFGPSYEKPTLTAAREAASYLGV